MPGYSFVDMAGLDADQLSAFRREGEALRFAPVASVIPAEVAGALAEFTEYVLLTGFLAGKRTLLFFEPLSEDAEPRGLCLLAVEENEWSSGDDRDNHAEEIRRSLTGEQLPSELGLPDSRAAACKLRIALARWIRGDISGEIK